jgi:Uma2 family endonuclease
MAVSHRKTDAESCRGFYNGDQMTQEEFHRDYKRMPGDFKAELLAGIVFEPSPLSYSHGKSHAGLSLLLSTYATSTAGCEVADNATVILSEDDEVQPDLFLRILPECGGQSRLTKDDYISGAPELVAEIALSSRAIDLHLKKDRYAISGVREYIVVCLRPRRLYWFNLSGKGELGETGDGIIRSSVFPGLWIHRTALLQEAQIKLQETLKAGLQSAEHTNFVNELARRTCI